MFPGCQSLVAVDVLFSWKGNRLKFLYQQTTMSLWGGCAHLCVYFTLKLYKLAMAATRSCSSLFGFGGLDLSFLFKFIGIKLLRIARFFLVNKFSVWRTFQLVDWFWKACLSFYPAFEVCTKTLELMSHREELSLAEYSSCLWLDCSDSVTVPWNEELSGHTRRWSGGRTVDPHQAP